MICLSCSTYEPGERAEPEIDIGRNYQTIPEAEEAAARHVEEAGALRSV